MLTDSILRQIEATGCVVSRHWVNGTVEMHAAKINGSAEPQIARCNDGDGPTRNTAAPAYWPFPWGLSWKTARR
jgi:hypothetical protein